MLPFVRIPDLPLGPVTLHAFGMLVATAVLLGYWLARRRARAVGLDELTLTSTVNWMLLAGFVGAHVFDVLAYRPVELREDPLVLLKFWAGLSSFGGFLGATIAVVVVLARRRQPILRYCDVIAWGLAPAWAIGRLGCAVAHDHPGRLTDFLLAVRYPDGPRFDLGLYEVPVALLLAVVLWSVGRRRGRPPGLLVGLLATLYGCARFALDFLRATDLGGSDPRYLGLTPAQHLCVVLVVGGGALLWYAARWRPPPAVTPPAGGDGD